MGIKFNAAVALGAIYQSDGGVYSANCYDAAAFDYFPNDAQVNDALYFGRNYTFKGITLNVGTAFAASSQTFVWEYYTTANTWATLTTDNLDAILSTGSQAVNFAVPSNWKQININSQYRYWIRLRISAVASCTEGGANAASAVTCGDNTIIVTGYSSETPCTIADVYAADVAGAWGVVTRLVGSGLCAYCVTAYVSIGDGSTATWFSSSGAVLLFVGCQPLSQVNSTWTHSIGAISIAANVARGWSNPYSPISLYAYGIVVFSRVTILLYESSGMGTQLVSNLYFTGVFTLTDVYSGGVRGLLLQNTSGSIEDLETGVELIIVSSLATATECQLSAFVTINGGTYIDFVVSGAITLNALGGIPSWYLINCSYGSLTMGGTKRFTAYFQYYFDLAVIDASGDPVSGASVAIVDAAGDAVSGSPFTTDANGEISRQALTQFKKARTVDSGSVVETTLTPHTVTISKAGYTTRVVPITMDMARVQVEMLTDAGPTAPSGLVATAISQTRIDLAWTDNSDDETGFRVERSPNGSTLWTHITDTAADATSFSDTGVECGTTYYYRVRAENADGESDWTSIDSATTDACPTAPVAPDSLAATSISQTEINLAWADNSDDETGFRIERSPDGLSLWAHITTTEAGVTSFADTGLSCGTEYYYRIRAENGYGESAWTSVANATTSACDPIPSAPDAPFGLIATAVSQTEINLAWTDNSDNETGFRIECSPDGSTLWTHIATTAAGAESYNDTGLNCNTTYYYRVCAVNAVGNSAYTSVAHATTNACTAPVVVIELDSLIP